MLLDPGNRFHMSPETHLRQLLETLDMVTSMCASRGRTKRMRLLRREINSIRDKLSCHRRTSRLLSGNIKKEDKHKEEGRNETINYATAIPGALYHLLLLYYPLVSFKLFSTWGSFDLKIWS